jgi:hypothetical protein
VGARVDREPGRRQRRRQDDQGRKQGADHQDRHRDVRGGRAPHGGATAVYADGSIRRYLETYERFMSEHEPVA